MTNIWETIWNGLTLSGTAMSSDVLKPRVLAAAGDQPPNTNFARGVWNQLLTSVAATVPAAAEGAAASEAQAARDAKQSETDRAKLDALEAAATVAESRKGIWAGIKQVAAKGPDPSTCLYRLPEPLGYPPSTPPCPLVRLYIGDLMWLYFYERMGVFRMLKRLIDDYSRYGRFPIEWKSAERLETLTRLAQSGEASAVGERAAAYLRGFGWSCEGLQAPAGIQANLSFDSNWRSFLRNALAYYPGKIISALFSQPPRPSGSSVVAVCDAACLLWESFKPFETSSNYSATYYGLAWAVGTLCLIELDDIKNALGMSDSTAGPAAISAAYEVLVLGQPPRGMDSSRYMVHNDCARYGRRILLDLQGLKNSQMNSDNTDLKLWLEDGVTESNIEGFRSAWQRLTGEDLSPAVPIAVSR